MKVVLVLGKRPKKDGNADGLKLRVKHGVSLCIERGFDCVIISGGETCEGFPSEAKIGEAYVRCELKSNAPLLLEGLAKSTTENVIFVKQMLGNVSIEQLVVVTSPAHRRRAEHLFRVLWPEVGPKISFDPVGNSSLRNRLVEAILFRLAVIDPDEQTVLLPMKRFLKNLW